MAYLGFDLDETLGSFGGVDIYLKYLSPRLVVGKDPSAELQQKLDLAFDQFAACLLSKPEQAKVLRPGLIDIFERLLALKDVGKIRAMAIYSNNGNPDSLRLADRMLQIVFGREDIFCTRIHWYHPLRRAYLNLAVQENIKSNEPSAWWLNNDTNPTEIKLDQPGAGVKSIHVLKNIFQETACGGPADIPNKKIYFFDDTMHANIYNKIGPNNYFLVNKFQPKQEEAFFRQCFLEVMHNQGLDTDPEYYNYLTPAFKKTGFAGFDAILANIDFYQELAQKKQAHALFPVFANDKNTIIDRIQARMAAAEGGRRRNRTKTHKRKALRRTTRRQRSSR